MRQIPDMTDINPEALVADGYDDCIVGIVSQCGRPTILCYDSTKIINKLIERDGMTREDAEEFFDFNILGAYMGPNTPMFLTPISELERSPLQDEPDSSQSP